MVFFSGEDMSELKDNTAQHTYYLSFIVNNNLNMCAKIAQKVESNETITYTDVYGKQVRVDTPKKDKIIVTDCQILYPNMESDFLDQLDFIIKEAEKKTTVVTVPAGGTGEFPFGKTNLGNTTYNNKGYYNDWNGTYEHRGKNMWGGQQGTLFNEPIPSFEGFVKTDVLDTRDDTPLAKACKEYEHILFDADDFLEEYQGIYGRTKTYQEDIAVLQKVIKLISPYTNKQISKLIREIENSIKEIKKLEDEQP